MSCADEAELEAFVAGELDDDARAALEARIDACPHCRRRLGELARQVDAMRSRSAGDEAMFAPAPDPYLGRTLSARYRIVRKLGSGGMGAVYEAEHQLIHRRVAIKFLHAHLATRREVLQRFRSEARAAGAIGHPGIVRALDVGRTEEGAPFLVLELLEGHDLEVEVASEGPLPVARALRIGADIADALVAAHGAGIVHRDLKPANIFLSRHAGDLESEPGQGDEVEVVKVLDFGISKVRGELQTGASTGAGVMLGTPAYMAPEQIHDAAGADARSDVYALGAILFRCLTGRLPRAGQGTAMLFAAITDPPPSARALRTEIPEAVDALLLRALHPDPHARPQTMAQMRDALRGLANTTRSTTIHPVGDSERRSVLVVAARGLRDYTRAEELLDHEGGMRIPPRGELFLGALGDSSWSGDLVDRAAALALALASDAEVAWVGTGATRAEGLELSDELDAQIARTSGPGAYLVPSLAHSRFTTVSWHRQGARLRLSDAAAQATELPWVGRAGESAQLDEFLDAAMHEGGRVCFVEGETGIGKSRLIGVLEERARPTWTVLAASCPVGGSDFALLRALGVLGAPTDPKGVARGARLSADRARLRSLEALEALGREQPLLIVVDDARHLDRASSSALREFARRCTSPLAIVFGIRSDQPRQLEEWTDGEPVHVRPRALRSHETRTVLEALLDAERAAAELPRVFEATRGNPLFIEQVGLALRERRADQKLPLPPSIEGMMQARLDELHIEEREILKRAAVLNAPFGADELHALGIDAVTAEDLRALVDKRLLRRAPRGFELESPLLAQAAYRMLGEVAVRELHGRAAHVLRDRAADAQLALHFDLAGRPAEAAAAYGRACRAARDEGDAERVLIAGRRALELAAAAPNEVDEVEVRRAVADALELRGDLRAQEQMLAEVEPLVEGAQRAAVETERAVALQRLGRSPEALVLLESAVARAERAADPDVLTRALGKQAVALTYAGEVERAGEVLRRAERGVLRATPTLRADAAIWRAQYASVMGEMGDARNAFLAAVELYEELGDPRRAAEASVNLADFYNRVGAFDEAVAALTSALDVCRRVGASRLMEGYACLNLANALVGEDLIEDAYRALDEAQAIGDEVGESRLQMVTRVYRAKALRAGGRVQAAQQTARAAAEAAFGLGFHSVEALAWVQVGLAALQREDVDAAHTAASRALTIHDMQGGMEEDVGALFVLLAQTLESKGDPDGARRAVARGRAQIEASATRLGDRYWRERYLARPDHRALLEDVA